MRRRAAHNTRLAQWGLTSFIETLCFYCKFVLVDNLVFQNPPLRQAWERYRQPKKDNNEKNNSKFCIDLKSITYLLLQFLRANITPSNK